MKTGFFTAILGDRPLEEVAHGAATAGFDALEIEFGRHVGDASRAAGAIEAVRREGLAVCALTCGPSLLNADRVAQGRVRQAVDEAVDAALAHGVSVVGAFVGRDVELSEDDNYDALAAYLAPLLERAAAGGVSLAIENWPGPRVDYLATTPAGWARLFARVPAPNLGLTFDPSHLLWQGIDPEEALHAVAGRVVLAHAKDTDIVAARQQQVGYFGPGWWTYRLPGHGRLDWRRWLSLLREVGYDGVISVEHEDPAWGGMDGPVERRWDGLREALRELRAAGME